MKTVVVLAVVCFAGCASSYRVDPSRIIVSAEPASAVCGQNDREIKAVLNVENRSRGVLKIGVWAPPGPSARPPFEVSWIYYDVLKNGSRAWEHGPGGHGPMPPNTLQVGPGDSAQLAAPIYELTPSDYSSKFSIRFSDEDENKYTSPPFLPCVSPSALTSPGSA
jgi:hypothetical protein